MKLVLGLDLGGERTKTLLWSAEPGVPAPVAADSSAGWPGKTPGPDLAQLAPVAWPEAIRRCFDACSPPGSELVGVGISLALPLVEDAIFDPVRKFPQLDRVRFREFAAELERVLRCPVRILHDGEAALWGEFAVRLEPPPSGNLGILTFGSSIGFGVAVRGEAVVAPYTSWVSHVQLRPDDRGPGCDRCGQRGCWRSLYRRLKGDHHDPKLAELDQLLGVMSQGIAAVLQIMPLGRLYLGGGWTRHVLNPATAGDPALTSRKPFAALLADLQVRLPFLESAKVIKFAQAHEFAGALGAAWAVSPQNPQNLLTP